MTVESILQAAMELIEREGFHNLTSTKIAERAGISVGSFYEYYPNREAVLLNLYERASSEAANVARDLIIEMLDLPIEKAIPQAVQTLYSVHAENQLILLDMMEEIPELKLSMHPVTYDRLAQGAVRVYLEHIGVRLSSQEMQRCLFFVNQMVMGSIRHYLRTAPSWMSPEEFITELSRMAISYLREIAHLY